MYPLQAEAFTVEKILAGIHYFRIHDNVEQVGRCGTAQGEGPFCHPSDSTLWLPSVHGAQVAMVNMLPRFCANQEVRAPPAFQALLRQPADT